MAVKIFIALLLTTTLLVEAAYSPSLALHLGYYSSIAYESAASISAWNCGRCGKYPLTNVKVFSNSVSDIQGFTGYSASLKAIILSFRGSSNINNWIINLSTNMVTYSKCSNCKVHNGFYTGYGLVKSSVNSEIQALRALYRDAPIYITGHSLGGALAILAAPELHDTFGGLNSVYTFGQPRVGNAQFATYSTGIAPTYRVIHNADIVPHVPPSAFTFVHGNTEVWYDAAMATHKTCQGDSPSCSNSLPATSFSTNDHSMDLYLNLKAVESLRQKYMNYVDNIRIFFQNQGI